MATKERVIVGATLALVLYTAILSMLGPASSSSQTSTTISNSATVKGIGVGIYWEWACTNSVDSIDWGALDPGSSTSKMIYIRNEGNTAAILSLASSNWNPAITSNYVTLSWNYGGQTLSVGATIQVELTLTVSSEISGITNFGFDITITASG